MKFILLPALFVASCATQGQCLLPTQHPMLAIELYFGRSIAGRPAVSDTEWNDFTAREITPRFPDGFSVLNAAGQWRGPTGQTVQEASKILRVEARLTPSLKARLTAIQTAYRTRFHQQAVGIVTTPSCAAF